MPTWTVQIAAGEEVRVEAEILATESGALVALSAEGTLLRASAPGQWRTVRHLDTREPDPAGAADDRDGVLVGFPRT